MWVALVVLAALAGLAWQTLDGRIRLITLIILGMFVFRIVLTQSRSRYDEEGS
jgi:hypothetical protein